MVTGKFTNSAYDPGEPQGAVLNRGEPTRLKGVKLKLEVSQQFEIVGATGERGPWKVHTLAYWYAITRNDGSEVIAYQWHPAADSHAAFPHLHIGSAELDVEGWLSNKTHIPTARIAIEDVVVLAIELGATPLQSDWEERISGTRARFRKYASWS